MADTVIFGGSFNPVHNGHVALVRSLLMHPCVQDAVIVPAACSPFKTTRGLASNQERFHMCQLAFGDMERVSISDIEFALSAPSFTIHTLLAMQLQHPEWDLGLLVGADAIMSFDQWKDYREILRIATLYTAVREEYGTRELEQKINKLEREGARVELLNMPRIDVSSTQIRKRIQNGISIVEFVPKPVAEYILSQGLYGGEPGGR